MVTVTKIRPAILTDNKSSAHKAVDAEQRSKAAGDDQQKCKALKDKDCTFNKEANKCELKKEVKEKPENAEGKEEGEGGKTGCSKLLNQPECWFRRISHPLPLTCRWINFTVKKGKLPKPESRSSSFFVNKNFALSMAAAFTILVTRQIFCKFSVLRDLLKCDKFSHIFMKM
uniref:Variant surface glycoprotein n=1 Tax=Trypanosoma brucei TaxID=5691 RepID=A0A1V0FZB1_9TRYP|nr:variant surface glycoprotein [Trypanosoma brucei]